MTDTLVGTPFCADNIGPALQVLLADCKQALELCDRPTGSASIIPGSVSWDNCCEGGGQLWVRVQSITPQPRLGRSGGGQAGGIDAMQVKVGVGVIRCMHGLTEEGFPTSEQMTEDAMGQALDATILFNAIRCSQYTPAVYKKSLHIADGVPLGPQGTCGGWEWSIAFNLGLCGSC